MKAAFAVLAALLLLGAARADTEVGPTFTELEEIPDSEFVFMPAASSSNSIYGTNTRRSSREWPALAEQGLAQTYFELEACAVRAPHVHQRASGLLYCIDCGNLTVAFVQENGTYVSNEITTGMSAIFPQGLVHFQYNNDCSPAKYTITYDDSEGATVNIVPALFKLPTDLVAVSLGLPVSTVENMTIPGHFFAGPEECYATCSEVSASASASP